MSMYAVKDGVKSSYPHGRENVCQYRNTEPQPEGRRPAPGV